MDTADRINPASSVTVDDVISPPRTTGTPLMPPHCPMPGLSGLRMPTMGQLRAYVTLRSPGPRSSSTPKRLRARLIQRGFSTNSSSMSHALQSEESRRHRYEKGKKSPAARLRRPQDRPGWRVRLFRLTGYPSAQGG